MFNFSNNNDKVINVMDIDDILNNIELIDIREPYEYRTKSIKNSKNIPMQELLSSPEKYLSKDKEYHIVCQAGGRSSMACNALRSAGFDVVNVAGGVGSYIGTNLK